MLILTREQFADNFHSKEALSLFSSINWFMYVLPNDSGDSLFLRCYVLPVEKLSFHPQEGIPLNHHLLEIFNYIYKHSSRVTQDQFLQLRNFIIHKQNEIKTKGSQILNKLKSIVDRGVALVFCGLRKSKSPYSITGKEYFTSLFYSFMIVGTRNGKLIVAESTEHFNSFFNVVQNYNEPHVIKMALVNARVKMTAANYLRDLFVINLKEGSPLYEFIVEQVPSIPSYKQRLLLKYGIDDRTDLDRILDFNIQNPESIDFYIRLLIERAIRINEPEDLIPHIPEPVKDAIAFIVYKDMLKDDLWEDYLSDLEILEIIKEGLKHALNVDKFIENKIEKIVTSIIDQYNEQNDDLVDFVYDKLYAQEEFIFSKLQLEFVDYIEDRINNYTHFLDRETVKKLLTKITNHYLFHSHEGHPLPSEVLMSIVVGMHYDEPISQRGTDAVSLGAEIVVFYVKERFEGEYVLHHFIKRLIEDYIERNEYNVHVELEKHLWYFGEAVFEIAGEIVGEYMDNRKWKQVVDRILKNLQ